MNTDSIKYHVLKVLADGDEPMTCEEIWNNLPEDKRPEVSETPDERPWDNLTSHTAKLYGDHLVDRRKRDVRWKPLEYWPAAQGRSALRENGDLPADETDDAPIPENTVDAVSEGADPDLSEDIQDFLEDPETEAAEAVAQALAGVVGTLHGLETAVDNLRESAVTEDELTDRLENGDFGDAREVVEAAEQAGSVQDLERTVETLKSQVQAISKAQNRLEGMDGDFAPYIRRLQALEQQGYGLYEGDMEVSYGGNVVEVRVKAKPAEKCDRKGPDASDGERVTVSKEGSDE